MVAECGASGEFNSITSSVLQQQQQQGRRRRRSTEFAEYSFPEDRPLPDHVTNYIEHLNTEPRPGAHPGNASFTSRDQRRHVIVSRDELRTRTTNSDSNISSNATAVIKEKMHSMMDVMDSRIEGVEGVMSDLQKTVHKLQRKVRMKTWIVRDHFSHAPTQAVLLTFFNSFQQRSTS